MTTEIATARYAEPRAAAAITATAAVTTNSDRNENVSRRAAIMAFASGDDRATTPPIPQRSEHGVQQFHVHWHFEMLVDRDHEDKPEGRI